MGIADGELTSMTLCWTAERSDGAGVAMTTHDRALLLDGVQYAPDPGMTPATVSRRLGLEAQSGEVGGAVTSAAITEKDLRFGRWDGAQIAMFATDWQVGSERIDLVRGRVGEVAMADSEFSAELVGAGAVLEEPVCPATSPHCRAEFGDKKCRVDLAGRTQRAKIVSAQGNELTLDAAVDGRFAFGGLVYLSGDNCGLRTKIVSANAVLVTVGSAPAGTIEAGTTVELREGCDKTLATCATRFGNAANFRGEPHLPGNDLLTRYPGA